MERGQLEENTLRGRRRSMLKIKIVVHALARPQLELEPVRLAAHEVGQAWLDDVEQADQAFAHAVASGERAVELFLAQPVDTRSARVGARARRTRGRRPGSGCSALWRRRQSPSTRRAPREVTLHETRLIQPAQGQPVEAGDYARDIGAVLRQKPSHAATMTSYLRDRFHRATLLPRGEGRHGLHGLLPRGLDSVLRVLRV